MQCKIKLPAYTSGGYYLDGTTPENLDEELAGYVGLGFKAVKMKADRFGPNEREAVEWTATIAAYNLVLRFLEALQIDHD